MDWAQSVRTVAHARKQGRPHTSLPAPGGPTDRQVDSPFT